MGGYGGALKQLSIGVASSYGKAYIHGAGVPEEIWTADHDKFLMSMADAAGSVSYVTEDMRLLGCLCFGDTERECAADVVAQLKEMGVRENTIVIGAVP